MGKKLGVKSYKEMSDQGNAWQMVLNEEDDFNKIVREIANQKKSNYNKAIFVGCGSSYYISLSGAFVFNKMTGIESKAIPASELMFYPDVYLNSDDYIIFAISRSGETTELIRAIKAISNSKNVLKLAVTCNENSTLVDNCDFSLLSRKGKEESVVMTKSFTSMLFSIQLFAGLWGSDHLYLESLHQLPNDFNKNFRKVEKEIKMIIDSLKDINYFNKYEFLGQGNFYGIANEAMLKMKEMALVPSEDFHSLEFRHGPKSIIDERMLITIYIGETTFDREIKLCKDLVNYGSNLLVIGKHFNNNSLAKNEKVNFIEINTELNQFALAPLFLVPSQLFAFHFASKKGIDVDKPKNLSQVVESI